MCSGAKYDEFLEDAKTIESNKECRYVVYDMEFEASDGRMISKILFFMWSVIYLTSLWLRHFTIN